MTLYLEVVWQAVMVFPFAAALIALLFSFTITGSMAA